MNKNISTAVVLSTLLILGTVGCHKTADSQIQIEQAAQAMAQTETPHPTASATPAASPVEQVNEALGAYKSGNYTEAVTRFQTMRGHTAMSGQQLESLNNVMAAVMSDLYARAAKGDAQAQAAIEEYRRLKSSPQ